MQVAIERATSDDIPFIMATERLPGYSDLVGSWDEDRHRAAISDERVAYFIGHEDGRPIGFTLVRDWNAANRVSLIQRVAVNRTDRGLGRQLVSVVVAAIFSETPCHRIAIGCFPHNVRARKAYEAVGFKAEGIARGSAFFRGEHFDELILGMVRPDWDQMNQAGSQRR
jgi:RimJ/RimL family protein N-acetyltransferase